MTDLERPAQYVCSCFFTHNIFLKDLRLHVNFIDRNQFMKDYHTILQQLGCTSNEAIEDVISEIHAEIDRRKKLPEQKLERSQNIFQNYVKLKPHVFTLQEMFFTPQFVELIQQCKDGATLEELEEIVTVEKAERVYSFPVFNQQFCSDLMDELTHFSKTDLPKGRPNTMNNYGVLLDEIGFDEHFLNPLREDFLNPLTKALFPDYGGGSLDSHKAFIVKYKMGEDLDLSYHYDNAEITLNVCLGCDFTGGGLYFGAMRKAGSGGLFHYDNKPGIGLLHRGQHMHGAHAIGSGERYNLIIWLRSSQVRNKLCPMCDRTPKIVKTVGIHDGFSSSLSVDVCNVQ